MGTPYDAGRVPDRCQRRRSRGIPGRPGRRFGAAGAVAPRRSRPLRRLARRSGHRARCRLPDRLLPTTGRAPSTREGPFTVAVAVSDALRVLDALGRERADGVGHCSGGHLLLHVAVAAPERLWGGWADDPLGGMGDGAMISFQKEMAARIPPEATGRAQRDEATAEDFIESLCLFWSLSPGPDGTRRCRTSGGRSSPTPD
jgi:hypothetical protein